MGRHIQVDDQQGGEKFAPLADDDELSKQRIA
jgi:hypothetical protein